VATIQRNPQGPLRYSQLIQYDEVLFWGITTPPPILPENDDANSTVHSYDRSDAVAYAQLGTSEAAWIIMERQDQAGSQMRLWPNDWYPGRRIAIPSRDSLSARGLL
jgi:hypothetical protein